MSRRLLPWDAAAASQFFDLLERMKHHCPKAVLAFHVHSNALRLRGRSMTMLHVSALLTLFTAIGMSSASGHVTTPKELTPYQACGITGHIFENGVPIEGVQVSLLEEDLRGPGAGPPPQNRSGPRGFVVTDKNGRYHFRAVTTLQQGRGLRVTYTNYSSSTTITSRVLAWYGQVISNLPATGCADGGDFDIANVQILAPQKDAQVFWGTPFTWKPRTKPPGMAEDRFQVCFDDGRGSLVDNPCLPTQPITETTYIPTPGERPSTILHEVKYKWYLRVSHEDQSHGYGFMSPQVILFNALPPDGTATIVPPTPTPSRTPAPPPGSTIVCPRTIISDSLSINLQARPAQADIIFAFDASNSMTSMIKRATTDADEIMRRLANLVPDIQFGVMLFRDHRNDEAYRLVQSITPDRSSIKTALASITTINGGSNPDGPEAYTRALYEAYEDRDVGWRPNSRRLMIMFGDEVPHDDDLNEGIPNPVVNPGKPWCGRVILPCFIEPGRNPSQDPPLDLQTVLDTLRDRQITLMFVVAAEEPTWRDIMLEYWRYWARRTHKGGDALATSITSSLPDDITALVFQALSHIGQLTVQSDPPTYDGWFEFNPPELKDINLQPGQSLGITFDYTLRVPPGAPLGEAHDIRLMVVGDGAPFGEQTIRLFIGTPPICLPPPPPPPVSPFVLGLPAITSRRFPNIFDSAPRQFPRLGPARGEAVTGIQIQNLHGGDKLEDARIEFYEQRIPYLRPRGSTSPIMRAADIKSLAAGTAGNLWVPELGLSFGIHTGVVHSDLDLPLAAIARIEWTATGGAALYSNVASSSELSIPIVLRDFESQTSIISFMSDGNRHPINVELTFFASGSSTPAATPLDFELQPYEGATVDLLDNHPSFDALGRRFTGTARLRVFYGIDRATDTTARIGAVSFVNVANSKQAIWAFEAIPSGEIDSQASNVLFVPLWRSQQEWRQSVNGQVKLNYLATGMAINNPNAWAVDVQVEFLTTKNETASIACRAKGSFLSPIINIAPHSNALLYQGVNKEMKFNFYPEDCFGSAVIRTINPDDRVNAIVNDAQNGLELAAAYNAIPAGQTHTKMAAPLFRNKHGMRQYTTGIQVMNTGPQATQAHINFFSDGFLIPGCGDPCDVEIQPLSSHTWYPPDITNVINGVPTNVIRDNVFGSAIVESDQPIAMTVVDFPLLGGVDSAVYNGIPMFNRIIPRVTNRGLRGHMMNF